MQKIVCIAVVWMALSAKHSGCGKYVTSYTNKLFSKIFTQVSNGCKNIMQK